MGLPRPQPSETVNRQESKQPAQDGEATAQPLEGQEDVDEAPLPPGFPAEDDFDHLICFKCVSSFPWIKQYAGQEGFLGPIHHKSSPQNSEHVTVEETTPGTTLLLSTESKKRTAEDDSETPESKKTKVEPEELTSEPVTSNPTSTTPTNSTPLHTKLPLPLLLPQPKTPPSTPRRGRSLRTPRLGKRRPRRTKRTRWWQCRLGKHV
jgi:E3 ubiquitin-protein ligase UBR7